MRNKPQREPVKIGDFVGFCYCDGTETVGTVIAMTQKRSRQKKGKIIPCVMIAQLPEGDANACSLVELALHGSVSAAQPGADGRDLSEFSATAFGPANASRLATNARKRGGKCLAKPKSTLRHSHGRREMP